MILLSLQRNWKFRSDNCLSRSKWWRIEAGWDWSLGRKCILGIRMLIKWRSWGKDTNCKLRSTFKRSVLRTAEWSRTCCTSLNQPRSLHKQCSTCTIWATCRLASCGHSVTNCQAQPCPTPRSLKRLLNFPNYFSSSILPTHNSSYLT
jgi:hypothetical protein